MFFSGCPFIFGIRIDNHECMIQHILPFLCLVMACSGAQLPDKHQKTYTTTGTLLQVAAYCKGVAPTDDEWRRHHEPRPYPQQRLYVRAGRTNDISLPVLHEVVTDNEGKFDIQLPEGVYCIVANEKKDGHYYNQLLEAYREGSRNRSPIDEDCLKKWLEKPLAVIEITEQDTPAVTITVRHKCSWDSVPCTGYSGPLPPAANPARD